jgi:hypothetical protein
LLLSFQLELSDHVATASSTRAGVPGAVRPHQPVAREKRAMGAAQVERHAVLPGNGNDSEMDDAWRLMGSLGRGGREDIGSGHIGLFGLIN